MTSNARVCAHVEIAEIAHSSGDAGVVGPIRASVAAQPTPGGAVARLTRNAFVGLRGSSEPAGWDRLQWRMTNRAASARLRPCDSQAFCNPFGPRIEQNRIRLCVKILPAPGNILAPLRTGATVTAGGFAADRSHKRAAALTKLPRLFRRQIACAREKEKADRPSAQQHAKRLAPAFPKMPLLSGGTGFCTSRDSPRRAPPNVSSPKTSTSCAAA